jgi:hypothetical protein
VQENSLLIEQGRALRHASRVGAFLMPAFKGTICGLSEPDSTLYFFHVMEE